MLNLLFTVAAWGILAAMVIIICGMLLLPVFAWLWWRDGEQLERARKAGLTD